MVGTGAGRGAGSIARTGRGVDHPPLVPRRRAPAAGAVGLGHGPDRGGRPRRGERPRRCAAPRGRSRWPRLADAPEPWDWRRFREVPVSQIDNKVRLTTTGDIGDGHRDRRRVRATTAGSTCCATSPRPTWRSPPSSPHTAMAQCGFALRVAARSGGGGVAQHLLRWPTPTFSRACGSTTVRRSTAPTSRRARAGLRPPGALRGRRRLDGDGHDRPAPPARSRGRRRSTRAPCASSASVIVGATPGPSTYTFASPLDRACGSRGRGAGPRCRPGRRPCDSSARRCCSSSGCRSEAEPSWDDPDRTVVNLLPDTLPSGAPTPLGPGGVGLLIAHLGDGGRSRSATCG